METSRTLTRQCTLIGCLALVVAVAPVGSASSDTAENNAAFRVERADFTIGFEGVETNLAIISTAAMPGEQLTVQTDADASTEGGVLSRDGRDWVWHAPDTPGIASINFLKGPQRIALTVFVMTPWQNGAGAELDGYRIGEYAREPFRGRENYRAPDGFIEVLPDMHELRVSPNFMLAQFLCKQQPDHDSAYLLLDTKLLLKLERLLEVTNEAGYSAPGFHIMSGFRTPWYNLAIGNVTTSSRHLFGGAADIFVDADRNGWMDDLNGDGEISLSDALVLKRLVEDLAARGEIEWVPGGLAGYAENSVHGPFLHLDARGYPARWGQ